MRYLFMHAPVQAGIGRYEGARVQTLTNQAAKDECIVQYLDDGLQVFKCMSATHLHGKQAHSKNIGIVKVDRA